LEKHVDADSAARRPWDVRAVTSHGDVPGGADRDVPRGVPGDVQAAAKAVFGAGPPADPVADLVYDSVLDPDADPAAARRLRFDCPDGGAELEVAEAGDTVTVRARVLPAGLATIEVRSKAPAVTLRTDERGAAGFDVPAGLVSLLISPAPIQGRRRLQTAWVRL
jgi:hypothetical protein